MAKCWCSLPAQVKNSLKGVRYTRTIKLPALPASSRSWLFQIASLHLAQGQGALAHQIQQAGAEHALPQAPAVLVYCLIVWRAGGGDARLPVLTSRHHVTARKPSTGSTGYPVYVRGKVAADKIG